MENILSFIFVLILAGVFYYVVCIVLLFFILFLLQYGLTKGDKKHEHKKNKKNKSK